VYNDDLQFKFTFRSGPMIFGRVMALGLWNFVKYLVVTTFFRYAWRYWLDTLTFDLMTPKCIGIFPFHRGIMWPSLLKIQYIELKLSCGNDPVVKNYTIALVLYIGSWPNLATWFPCGRGRTLFILRSLPLYRLIIYIDEPILWCTHFLLISALHILYKKTNI
jgi:hypothetical protein